MGAEVTLCSSLINVLVLSNMGKGFWSDLILLIILIVVCGFVVWAAWNLYKEMKK